MPRKLTQFTPDRGYTREDWDEVSDPHNPTEAQWTQAKPFAEVFPELAETLAAESAPKAAVVVSLPIDRDVLDAWRATGPGWKARMSAVLRAAIPAKA